MKRATILLTFLLITTLFSACAVNERKNASVVVYTSVDQVFSEPVFKDFEAKTGIKVLAVYDVEAAKAAGLANRLIAEKDRPQADVFWNGEFANTILLKEKGVLAKYDSPSAADIPSNFKDSESYWTGFGGRARVILVNKNILTPENYPKSIYDIFNEKYDGRKIGIAYPVFGTTATFAAAMYANFGQDEGKEFFSNISDRKIQIYQGNSVVKDMVAAGTIAFGLTDSDDAYAAMEKGAPVEIIIPDQEEGGLGTLIIPNTAAMIAKAPHPDNAKKFMDYILSKEMEGKLLEAAWIDLTVRPVDAKPKTDKYMDVKSMKVDFGKVYEKLELVKKEMAEIFVK